MPRVLDHVAGAAIGGDLADQVQNQVLGGDACRKLAVDPQFERSRLLLAQGLRGQHVFDFAGADAERQRTERSVRRRVAVAAYDGHAGLRVPQFRTDHVHDALADIVQVVQLDAEFPAIRPQGVDLSARDLVGNRQVAVRRRNIVVRRGDGPFRPDALRRPARRSPSNACGLVTSCTSCRSMYRIAGLPGSA